MASRTPPVRLVLCAQSSNLLKHKVNLSLHEFPARLFGPECWYLYTHQSDLKVQCPLSALKDLMASSGEGLYLPSPSNDVWEATVACTGL